MARPKERSVRRLSALLAAAAVLGVASDSGAARRHVERVHYRARAVNGADWLGLSVGENVRLRLTPGSARSWLERYLRPWENHTPEWRAFLDGRYGPRLPLDELRWHGLPTDGGVSDGAPLAESLYTLSLPGLEQGLFGLGTELSLDVPAVEPERLAVARSRPCPRWRAPRPVTVVNVSGERERLAVFDCDGAIAAEVIDRLSLLARSPGSARPELPLPIEPSGGLAGEWLPGVHLLDPRLVWALGKIGEAFPDRPIVLYSGYRAEAHSSLHQRGRALDLTVRGVPNEDLLRFCRRLRDVGCGFYPNAPFLHVDVRRFAIGRVVWVDVSKPGEPSEYVDGWPGVVAPGVAWRGAGRE